jgi:hypothetical protein
MEWIFHENTWSLVVSLLIELSNVRTNIFTLFYLGYGGPGGRKVTTISKLGMIRHGYRDCCWLTQPSSSKDFESRKMQYASCICQQGWRDVMSPQWTSQEPSCRPISANEKSWEEHTLFTKFIY